MFAVIPLELVPLSCLGLARPDALSRQASGSLPSFFPESQCVRVSATVAVWESTRVSDRSVSKRDIKDEGGNGAVRPRPGAVDSAGPPPGLAGQQPPGSAIGAARTRSATHWAVAGPRTPLPQMHAAGNHFWSRTGTRPMGCTGRPASRSGRSRPCTGPLPRWGAGPSGPVFSAASPPDVCSASLAVSRVNCRLPGRGKGTSRDIQTPMLWAMLWGLSLGTVPGCEHAHLLFLLPRPPDWGSPQRFPAKNFCNLKR